MDFKVFIVAAIAMLLGGCASAVKRHDQVAFHLSSPIDCNSAANDIMILKDAKASSAEKLANGIATILPTTAILNLFAGEWSSRRAIAFGEFDKMLTMKISTIEMECGVDGSKPSIIAGQNYHEDSLPVIK